LNKRKRPKTLAQYANALEHLLSHLPKGLRFVGDLATADALDSYLEILEADGFAKKTIHTRMGVVFSLLLLEQGFWAEVIIGQEHLRLFSERSPLGVQASVYNVNAKTWIAPSEPVDDIDQGKERAEAYAAAYLRRAANSELPSLNWKKSRSV
jgi:hypothetical protein